ncbi:unnamed protein product [Adineta steineri]|uniref:Uncharacterized protein n=1 Tax=Adineta steineri TaxID=433720 RepID=A0A815LE39_9BILA|nr:unnamed protein product [Adineta steineri]CAF4096402.1 unnamed protein product [Adineta steineri]
MTATTHINTKTLPTNVFDLQHDDFYNFVEHQSGIVQANILKVQLISDAITFLECNDPTEILQHNGEKLIDLKHKACIITNGGVCIVLAGIVASFKTLKKRLIKKIDEDNKKNKYIITDPATSINAPIVNRLISNDEQRNHIITTINNWFTSRRDEFRLKHDAMLEENINYQIQFKNINKDNESATIICGCGTRAALTRSKNTGYYQMSNYYRHVERCTCTMMLEKVDDTPDRENVDEENDDNNDNNTNSNNSDAATQSPSIERNHNKTSLQKRRAPAATTTTSRRSKRRRV